MKIVSVVGARPQFVKEAVVGRALRARHEVVLVHTGQHNDAVMSDVFFEDLEIPRPDHHLGVSGGTHAQQTGAMLPRLEEVMQKERPDWVLVHGDTNSTLAAALAAVKLHLPIAHVEAGLRCFDRRVPEEVNRIMTDHVSTLLFAPTRTAMDQLAREGIVQGVHLTGDVMVDALSYGISLAARKSRILEATGLPKGGYTLATLHRASNVDDRAGLERILAALREVEEPIVLPLHPRTRVRLAEFGLAVPPHVRLLPPARYLDFLELLRNARLVLTDSGGVQKDAYLLGVPCVTLRDVTEWVETVSAGWNVLVGNDTRQIVDAVRSFRPTGPRPPFLGQGDASGRIADLLASAGGQDAGRSGA